MRAALGLATTDPATLPDSDNGVIDVLNEGVVSLNSCATSLLSSETSVLSMMQFISSVGPFCKTSLSFNGFAVSSVVISSGDFNRSSSICVV